MYNGWGQKQTGFTIVELLIVVVVIAILAAITIVSYGGIRRSAQVSMVKTDLANIAKQMEIFKTQYGAYPTVNQKAEWVKVFETSAGNLSDYNKKSYATCGTSTGNRYAVVSWGPIETGNGNVGDELYYVSSENGAVKTVTYQGITHNNFIGSSLCYLALGSPYGAGWSYQLYY